MTDDERLLALVAPPGWKNPRPAPIYDLVVIGGGTAGLVCAAGARGLGARVALIEKLRLGGDCLHSGCVPSKALLRAARTVHEMRHGAAGVSSTVDVDFSEVMRRVRQSRVSLAPNDSAERFASLGVDVFFGVARFEDGRTVSVGSDALRFRRSVIATGSRPTRITIPHVPADGVFTTDTLFDLTDQPASLLIIGAGATGCEMAQAFALLGTRVTLVDTAPRVLNGEDPDASTLIARALERCGVTLQLGSPAARQAPQAVLLAAGRTPDVEGLNLPAVNVAVGADGVQVDDFLRTTNPRVYAAGDVCSRHRFTHAADAMARIAIQNALFFGRKRVSALAIPRCTYTMPNVASVGTLAGDAVTVPLNEIDRSVIDSEVEGFVRIVHSGGTVVGGTLVAPHAGEVIGQVADVVRRRASIADLSGMIFPYPTVAEGLRKVGDRYRRQSLTPTVRRLLNAYFRLPR